MTRLSQLLRQARMKSGLSASQIGFCLNVTRAAVYHLESGKMGLPIEMIPSVCLALNLSEIRVIQTMSLDYQEEIWKKLDELRQKRAS